MVNMGFYGFYALGIILEIFFLIRLLLSVVEFEYGGVNIKACG